jgi:PAS domain S-box-containing protein
MLKKADNHLDSEKINLFSESTISQILDISRIGYWDWNIPTGKEISTLSIKKLFGYEEHEIPDERKAVFRLILEEDMPKAMKAFYAHVNSHGNIPFSCELRNQHKDGSIVWLLTRGNIVEWDASGNPVRMIGCTIDISDQKNEQELNDCITANLEAVLRNTKDIIASFDRDLRLITYNKAMIDFMRIFCSIEICPGMRVIEYFPESLKKLRDEIDKRALTGESFTIEYDVPSDDGAVRSYEASYSPLLKNNTVAGFTNFMRDITERKKTERAFAESEENYKTLVNNMQDAVYRCDINGNLTFASPSGAVLLGYSSVEELMGQNIAKTFYFCPEERTKFLELLNKYGKVSEYEVTLRRKDNTPVIIKTNSHFYRDSGGKIIGIEGVYHDVTEWKHAENALKESEAKYRSLINNMQDAVFKTDIDGKILFCSPVTARILGYSSEDELIGMDAVNDIYACSEDRKRIQELLINHGKITNFRTDLKRKDGSIVTVLTHSQYCYDLNGKIIGVEGIYHDVTDQIKAEDALKKNEELLKSLFDASPAGIALVVNRTIIKVNNTFCRITGYSEVELNNTSTRILYFDDEEYNRVGLTYNNITRTELGMIETRYRKKDGSEIFVLLCLSPLNHDDFESGVVATLFDITEKKLAEKELRANQGLLQSIFESSPSGITMLVNRVFTKVNTAMCHITGYTENELCGNPTRMLYFNDNDYNRVGLIYSALEKKSSEIVETRFRRKDGTEINVLISLNTINQQNVNLGVVAIVLDITQIKKTELALKKNENLMQSIFNASPAGITLLDNRKLTMANDELCKITGYTKDEIIGKNARMFYFDDEEYNRIGKLFNQIKDSGLVITEALFRKKDGSAINVLISFNALDKIDSSAGIVSTLLDITGLKKIEHEKQKLEEMLLHSQKLESMGRLAGGIAHDFNNMLTAILGNADLAKEYISESNNAYPKLEIIQNAAMSAANLTKQLLAFSRKQVIEPKFMNLNDVINNVQKMIVTLLGENIKLSIVSDNNLSQIKADPGQIEQIILNLSVNARDAMPNGGNLIIETRNTSLDEEYSKSHLNVAPGSYVMLAMSDTGIGMSKETISHCFEPFYTTKEKGKGTGLGLSTVYGIINQSGGTIEVYSETGKGTVFKLYFPIAHHFNNSNESKPENTGIIRGNETILIAEDNEFVLQFSLTVLMKAGYNVMSATTGENAISIALNYKEKIHLLITDVILPGINGKETSEKMKLIHKETKTLYNSGYTAEVIDKQGILDSGINFISKPYTAKQLLLKVREILDSM